MAKQRRGENGTCGRMQAWWATVPQERREAILAIQHENPGWRPCPDCAGGWVRITATCDYCEDAVFQENKKPVR